jgi:zinc protease
VSPPVVAPGATDTRPAPDPHRFTLPNGLRVLLAPDPSTPVVAVAVHVDVGFRSEPEGRTGFAHLFEHLMFQGSESLEKLAHFRHVQGSGGVFNGSTHQDYTDYFEVLPAAALERALFLEADRLRAPRLTEENLRNQVDVVKEEIRLNVLSRPYGGFPWILLPPVLYDTFPNAHNGYGDFSELEQATLDDAAAFFDSYYAPGNVVLTVAGDLAVDEATALVEKHFGDIPERPVPVRGSFAEPMPVTERRRAVPDPRAPLPALALGYRLPDPTADLDGYLAHALLGSVLTDGEAARLRARLVHGEGIVTDISAGCGLFNTPLDARDPDTFTITAVHPVGVDPDRVVRAVDEELDRLAAGGPDAVELARISARWSASLYHEQDRVMSRTLALGARELLFGRAELAAELPSRLAAVTPAQVAASAGRLRGQGRAVLIVEPSGAGLDNGEAGSDGARVGQDDNEAGDGESGVRR